MLFDVALVVFRHGFASGVEVHGAWRWLLPAVPLDHEAGERAEVCVCPLADPHPRQERCPLLELADFCRSELATDPARQPQLRPSDQGGVASLAVALVHDRQEAALVQGHAVDPGGP